MDRRKYIFQSLLEQIRHLKPPKSEERYFVHKWLDKWAEAESIDREFERSSRRPSVHEIVMHLMVKHPGADIWDMYVLAQDIYDTGSTWEETQNQRQDSCAGEAKKEIDHDCE